MRTYVCVLRSCTYNDPHEVINVAGILGGNIFESMRIILPEHRATMKRFEHQQSKREKQNLSEDQINDMQYTISEAIENDQEVCVTLFGEYGNKTITGHPIVENGRLRLQTEDGLETVTLEKLLNIEIV